MHLRILGSSGGATPDSHLPSILINGTVLLEAGSAPSRLPLKAQLQVEHVLVSHAHLDHTGGLGYLADNVLGGRDTSGGPGTFAVRALPEVIRDLRAHYFNGRLWPDFTRIPGGDVPVLRLAELPEKAPAIVGSLAVRAVRVNHTVPAAGFVINDARGALVFSGDTGPTRQLWQVAREVGRVRAVIVDTSFPDRLHRLAEASGHLTPSMLARDLDHMPPCPVWAYHLKPAFRDEITEELERLGARVRVLTDGEDHEL